MTRLAPPAEVDLQDILSVAGLHTYFDTEDGISRAVNGVSYRVAGARPWPSSASPAAARP